MSSPASSGASPAPSGNPASGPAPSQGGYAPTPSHGGESGGFDPTEAIREARQARQETGRLRSNLDRFNQDHQQTRETLDRVRQAFVPEKQDAAPDPVSDLEQQMDYYLEQAMEAKSRGQPMPLTTNLALRFFQSQIENHKVQAQLLQQIKELKGGVQQANSPEKHINDSAYGHMESAIQNQLDSLYGTDPGAQTVKGNVYQSVVKMLQADLTELQQKAPHVWDQLRRNPTKLAQIVQKAVGSIVPPRAMQIIQQEQLQNTPMEVGELWAAFRQVDSRTDLSPTQRKELKGEIRRDILDAQLNARNPRRRQRR